MFFSDSCGIEKLFCKLRHKIFINLCLRQKINLLPSTPFSKFLRSGKINHFAACGST